MRDLPTRGPAARRLGLPLPPLPMPALHRGRPLKRWRYVGVYRSDVMLCVGEARVGGVPQRWWAVALPDGTLLERTTHGRAGVVLEPGVARVRAGGVSIDLALEEPAPVEVVSPHGRSWIWTAKRAPVRVHGRVDTPRASFELDGEDGFIDESAGYHARHTAWRWSAGLGRAADGRRAAWNLVDGVHDGAIASERTVWLDGESREVEPQAFAADLSAVGALEFRAWSVREQRMFRGYARSYYRQPFGEFSGELPGGVRLAEAYGVMEEHDVRW